MSVVMVRVYSLGALYWNGNGVEQDMMFGLKCFQLAGMHGEAAGFEELAKRAVEGVQLTFHRYHGVLAVCKVQQPRGERP